MRADPPPAHVAVRLRACVSAVARQLRHDPRADALAPAKWNVLALLHRHGPLSPSELARHERVRVQTLTRLLAELAQAGLVRRAVDRSDARRHVLSLTIAGRRQLTAEVHRREASLRRVVETRFDAGERADLLAACALLDRLADGLAAASQAAAASR